MDIKDARKSSLFLGWEYEDELPDSITDGIYSAMFKASTVDLVRLFPYVEIKGERFYLIKLEENVFVGDSDHEHDDRIL